MKAILERRSIRKYKEQALHENDIHEILKAAMSAPSAGNAQTWHFVVVTDRELLNKITEIHNHSQMLKQAPAAILVCADPTLEKYEGYWVQDCAAATENMLITIQDKGLGGVWLGVYPKQDRVAALRELFGIPQHVVPFSIVSLGYPAEEKEPANRFNQEKVHKNKW